MLNTLWDRKADEAPNDPNNLFSHEDGDIEDNFEDDDLEDEDYEQEEKERKEIEEDLLATLYTDRYPIQ